MTSMTDNRTTELLREGLTEHGIEWRSGLKGVTFVGDWCFVEYDNGKLAATCEPVLTPEQAIAATMDGGTFAIEQIKDAVLKNFHYDHSKPPLFDWQAIADELNAELEIRTCKLEETESYSNANEVIHLLECSECGRTCEHVNGSYPRCPHCGAKAVER